MPSSCRCGAACSSPSLRSVSIARAWSSFSVSRNFASASRRSSSTVVNGANVARLRRPIRSALPERLSSVLITKSPLFANAVTRRWPRKFCTWAQSRSLSMSTSPTSTRFALSVEALCSVLELVVDRRFAAFGRLRRPVRERGLEGPFEPRGERVRHAGCLEAVQAARPGRARTESVGGQRSASVLDWSSGVSLLVAPSAALK